MSSRDDDVREDIEQESLLEVLGERIRALRVSRGYSQAQLADRAGLSLPSIGALERAQANPSALTLAKLALALNADINAFFPSVPELRTIWPKIDYIENQGQIGNRAVSGTIESEGRAVVEGRGNSAKRGDKGDREHIEDSEDMGMESLLSTAFVAQLVHVEPRTIQKWVQVGLLTPAAYIRSGQKRRYAVFRQEDLPRIIEVRNRASVRLKRKEKNE